MTTLKFDKSVKYKGVRYDAHVVFSVDDEDVAELKKAGATVIATEEEEKTPPATPEGSDNSGTPEGGAVTNDETDEDDNESDEDVAELKEKLLDFTLPELTAFADERGIDLKGKTRKADVYNAIVATLE